MTARRMLAYALVSCAVFGLWLVAGHERPAQAATTGLTLTVNSNLDLLDATPGDGLCETVTGNHVCTLRAAILEANATEIRDTILLPSGIYTLTRAGIGDNGLTGDLDIYGSLTLQGDGALTTIIDGNGALLHDRVISIQGPNTSTVTIADVTVRHGATTGSRDGGAIFVQTSLTLTRSSLTNNSADFGGGLYVNGSAWVIDSTLSNNSATYDGGGIEVGGALSMINSTVSFNSAGSHGGGLDVSGVAYLYNASIVANFGAGGGIYTVGSTLFAQNTLLADNRINLFAARSDCDGPFTSEGYNLITDTTGCTIINDSATVLKNVAANVGLLEYNGGPTKTVALLADSPAVNGGDQSGCRDGNLALIARDQRGFARPIGQFCDIGAYEFPRQLFVPLIRR